MPLGDVAAPGVDLHERLQERAVAEQAPRANSDLHLLRSVRLARSGAVKQTIQNYNRLQETYTISES